MSDEHTRALPADAVLSLRVSAAYRDGRDTAAARGRRTNPWDVRDTDVLNRALALAWTRGYQDGNPVQL